MAKQQKTQNKDTAQSAAVNTEVDEAAKSAEQNTPAPKQGKQPKAVHQLSETKRRIDS